mgnify:FL=1
MALYGPVTQGIKRKYRLAVRQVQICGGIQKRKEPGAGGGCARLLNLIGNWEEEEYCRSYGAALGGGVRRFDALVISTAFDSAKRACCNAAVRKMHGLMSGQERAATIFAATRFRIFRIGAFL